MFLLQVLITSLILPLKVLIIFNQIILFLYEMVPSNFVDRVSIHLSRQGNTITISFFDSLCRRK